MFSISPINSKRERAIRVVVSTVVSVALFALLFVASAPATAQVERLAVPAEFVRYIKMPGAAGSIHRPSVLHYDRFHDEVLVGDSGNNRVAVFGSDGVFRFEFSLANIMTSPRDIATDPDGSILVLGSDPRGPVISRFDFDGQLIKRQFIPETHEERPVRIRHLVCDGDRTLFALDSRGHRILILAHDLTIERSINLERDNADLSTEGIAFGSFCEAGDELYLPVGNLGTVYRYSKTGEFRGSIGTFGSEPGKLNFPVAAEVSPDGLLLVLDRPRYAVVCFAPDGKFIGEFGGKGVSPGWFMGPSLLTVSAPDRIIVGQVYQNKIQVCALPGFIGDKLAQIKNEQPVLDISTTNQGGQ